MTAILVHPLLGTDLPPHTVPVSPAERDWSWPNNARRRIALVALVLRVKGRTCHLCGKPGATTADHLIPWSHGGANVLANLQPAHQACNSARRDRPLVEWFAHRTMPSRRPLTPSRVW